jgi:hypothetical protein
LPSTRPGRATRSASGSRSNTPSASPPTTATSTTRLRAHFADDEILDLTLCCAVFVGLGRTLEVLQITDTCPIDL